MHDHSPHVSEADLPFLLTDDEKRFLLGLAREAIKEAVAPASAKQDDAHSPSATAETLNDLAEISAGVFVSLHINDALRGCIGYLDALQPLPAAVQDTAKAAALRDPRFDPVREDELQDIDIEVSVLMPLEKISGPDEIIIGRDGLMIRCGKQQGVLLPQVAVRAEFEPISFVEHTCLKAGLPKDAWKLPECEVFRFKAEVFGERSM
jgi:AmmeMemoRadiSam system protein A